MTATLTGPDATAIAAIVIMVGLLAFLLFMPFRAGRRSHGTGKSDYEIYQQSKRLSQRRCSTLHEYDLLHEEVLALKKSCHKPNGAWGRMIDYSVTRVAQRRRLDQIRGMPYTYSNLLEAARQTLCLPPDFDRHQLNKAMEHQQTKYDAARLKRCQAPDAVRTAAKQRLEEAEKAYKMLLNERENRLKKF